MNFHDAALDLKALRDHFDDEREMLVSESLEGGLGLYQQLNVEDEGRRRNAGLTVKEKIERVLKGTRPYSLRNELNVLRRRRCH